MKKLFIAIAALAAMTSCSQDEVLEVAEKQAISFNNGFINNATRAIDPSYVEGKNELTQFNVWGAVKGEKSTTWVPIFNNDNVEGTVGNDEWNCTTNTQYWIPSASYQFAAVVYDNANVNFGTLTDGLPTQVTFTSDDRTDLLYDLSDQYTGPAASETPELVEFNFEHMLAKAVVTVTNSTNTNQTKEGEYVQSGYYYKVTNIKFLNVKKTGTCTFVDKGWNTLSNPQDVEFGNITNAAQDATDGTAVNIADKETKTSHYENLIIPQDFTTDDNALKVQFTVELYKVKADGETTDSLVNEDTLTKNVTVTFTAGYAYNFNIIVGIGKPIQFTVKEYPGWTDYTNNPVVVNPAN